MVFADWIRISDSDTFFIGSAKENLFAINKEIENGKEKKSFEEFKDSPSAATHKNSTYPSASQFYNHLVTAFKCGSDDLSYEFGNMVVSSDRWARFVIAYDSPSLVVNSVWSVRQVKPCPLRLS